MMALPASTALWFLPFVVPLCFYVAFTDLAQMRITNQAVVALALIFVIVGLVAVPLWAPYLWQMLHLPIVLGVTMVLTAARTMGAGDAKFLTAASPYVAIGDLRLLIALFAATLLAAFVSHRVAKHTPLRRLAPHWLSWNQGKRLPMGLALGPTLAIYLILGAIYGA